MDPFDGSVGDTKLGRGKTGIKVSWGQWNKLDKKQQGYRLWCWRNKQIRGKSESESMLLINVKNEQVWRTVVRPPMVVIRAVWSKKTMMLPWYQFRELLAWGAWKISNGVFRKHWVLSVKPKGKFNVKGSGLWFIHSLNKCPLTKTACFFKSNKDLGSEIRNFSFSWS